VAPGRGAELQGAALAYRDPLQIDRSHAQAQAKLQALGPQAQAFLAANPPASAPAAGAFGAVPGVGAPRGPETAPPPAMPGGPAPDAAPPMPGAAAAPPPAPPLGAVPPPAPPPLSPLSPPPVAGPLGSAPLGADLTAEQGPPGTVQCANCKQWTRPGLSCEFCSSPLRPPTPAMAPPPPGAPVYTHTPGPGAYAPGMGFGMGAPHRGGLILALGIIGLVVCGPCGIVAWVLGNQDIAAMDSGRMDPSGRGLTQTGRVLGIIDTSLMALYVLVWVAFFILALIGGRH